MRKLSLFALLLSSAAVPALAQDAPAGAPPAAEAAPPAAEATPAAAPPPAPEKKKHTGGAAGLGLDPSVPQSGAILVSPVEVVAPPEENTSSEWKFDVTGYFRAPLRLSWGPANNKDLNNAGAATANAGTQIRTPPLVPDANYIDWRYTNSQVGPWTELNFHYGNSRVKATIQIASYNLTDAGYRRLESNLGINESFLSINWPEIFDDNSRFTLTVGGYTNRYGAAGRYDGGKYETYLFGRTHVAGETGTLEYDLGDSGFTASVEEGFGGKLEVIPWLATPSNPNQNLAFNPFPGPVPQESTFVAHIHGGVSYKKQFMFGAHYIDTFANERVFFGALLDFFENILTAMFTEVRSGIDPSAQYYTVMVKDHVTGTLGEFRIKQSIFEVIQIDIDGNDAGELTFQVFVGITEAKGGFAQHPADYVFTG